MYMICINKFYKGFVGYFFVDIEFSSICLLTHGISALRYFGYGLLVYARIL